jgi:hypothetical protein
MHKTNQNSSFNEDFSPSKDDAIKLLKQTIIQLEGIISQLDVKDDNIVPSLESCQQLWISTQNLVESLEVETPSDSIPEAFTEEKPPDIITPDEVIPPQNNQPQFIEEEIEELIPEEISLEIPKEGLDKILPSFNKVLKWWDRTLLKIRAYLPSSINDKISDWGMTGVISGLVVMVLLTSVILLPDNFEPSSPIKDQPPISQMPESQPSPEIKPPVEPIKTIETPLELTEPKKPIPVKIVEPPQPKLTPEQRLITGIKNQLADLTGKDAQGLIVSIQANFTKSRLKIIVNEEWSQLSVSKQQQLSNKFFNKAEFLDFKKLEIINQNGDIIARSPVLGHEMILLVP